MIEKDAQERELRIRARADELYKTSHLPNRLSKHEEEKKANEKNNEKLSLSKEHTFKPAPRKLVPNFDKQYNKFNDALKDKREKFVPTQIQPFNLEEGKKTKTKQYPSKEKIEKEIEIRWKDAKKKLVKEWAFQKMFEKKKDQQKTTIASVKLQEKNRKMIEDRKIQEEKLDKEEKDRIAKQNRLK